MLKHWILASRPKTLSASLAPVLMGSAMAFGDGGFHWPSALCALGFAVFIQIGTNLSNDYFDFIKGADQNRVGPVRVSQAGLIKPRHVLVASMIMFLLAMLISVYLICRGGNSLLILALAAVVSGICYTAGKKPLGYLGLGELFVFIFFGPVAVAGTYYVQTLEVNLAVIMSGFAPGFISCAIIAINNLRDMDGDRKAHKQTLAVRLGRSFAMCEFLFLILCASYMPFLIHLLTRDHEGIIIASVIGFFAIPVVRTVFTSMEPSALNNALAKTSLLLMCFSLLFSAGWIVCSR